VSHVHLQSAQLEIFHFGGARINALNSRANANFVFEVPVGDSRAFLASTFGFTRKATGGLFSTAPRCD